MPPSVAKASVNSAKYSAGPNSSATLTSCGARNTRPQVAKNDADEGGDARSASASPAWPLLRHRIAVERGHQRRLVAGNVEQDRRDAAAIHGAVIDAGQQDQRRRRRQAEREGQRDQNGHAVRRPEARQRADDGAEKAAEQRQRRDFEGQRDRRSRGRDEASVSMAVSSEAPGAARPATGRDEVEDDVDADGDARRRRRPPRAACAEPPGEIGRRRTRWR